MKVRPYFHPTTTAIIDDCPDFLSNLGLDLDASLSYRTFVSPLEALDALNSIHANVPGPEQFFSFYQGSEEHPLDHHIIDLNLARIYREVFSEKRFQRYSVMVVDYDMPEMNGLELCRRLKQSPTRKVLLTGKADEKVAVKAFNEGIIDHFIAKQDPDAMKLLQDTIRNMQDVYFQDVERMIEDSLDIGPVHFLRDPVFAERFRKICSDLNIVEFYLCSSPDGMLLIDDEGASTLMVIYTDEAMELQYEVAFDNAAPADLLDALGKGTVVPYFWRSHGFYSEQHHDWPDDVYPAIECDGLQRYRYALVKEPQGLFLPAIFSYNQHLQRIDDVDGNRHRA